MAKLSFAQINSLLIRLSVTDFDDAYTALEKDIESQISVMRAQGVADAIIKQRLNESLNNGMDMFQTFKGKVGRVMDSFVNQTTQTANNEMTGGKGEMFVWELDPTAKDHCDTCLYNSKQEPQDFDFWMSKGLPGMGTTDCGKYCKCTLSVTA